MKIKDFPIMFSYFIKNIIKEKNIYTFEIFDWQYRYRSYGIFSIKAVNINDLKNKILKTIQKRVDKKYGKK